MTLDKELSDSLPYLNKQINIAFQDRLDLINLKLQVGRSRYRRCPAVALSLMNSLRFFIHQPLERLLEKDRRIALYPPRHIAMSEYYKQSIHRGSYYEIFTPLGRTLNANGIYLGMDKLGHFVSFGARYYRKYRKLRDKGSSEEEALREAAYGGILSEVLYVGKWISGVLSFADLEANFQGCLLLKDLCEPKKLGSRERRAYLKFKGDRWRFSWPIDLRYYVNPDWDESYNQSAYHALRWWTVRSVMAKYCPLLTHKIGRARFRYYQRIYQPSLNTLLLRSLWKAGEVIDPSPYRLANYCQEQKREKDKKGKKEKRGKREQSK